MVSTFVFPCIFFYGVVLTYQDGFGALGVVKYEVLPLAVVVCGEEGVDHESADQSTAHVVF